MNTYIKIMLAVLLTVLNVSIVSLLLFQGYGAYMTLAMMGVL